ncbi:hypothetical protein HID58_017205 [Brassica napus]|uniref:Uncharacterized protein n=1 Tax=Brassica napus TaxID=3708 RepID=A0ABQ8D6G2_BRANA|nr:hypothetical protein HID58_017205 [Brassica napus]
MTIGVGRFISATVREREKLTFVLLLMTAAAVTGVSSPEPPDPPEPPDLTSAFTTSSTSVCVSVLTLTFSDLDLKIQTFREIDLSSQIFKETFLLKDVGLVILIVVFIRPLTAIGRSVSITSYHEAHPSLVFTMSPTTGSRSPPSLDPLILLPDTSLQYDCLPYIPFGLSGSATGSSVPKIMYASMFILFKGSSIWCFVASACDAELLIVKAASVAVSISGVRPVLVLSNSQSFISLLSTIGVEFRGLLSDIMSDVLAGLALVLLDVNNFSSYGD